MILMRTLAATGMALAIIVAECFGYDDKVTHRDMSEAAANSSVLNEFLKKDLLLSQGREQPLPSENGVEHPPTVTKWLRYGAMQEDAESRCRASNHFHNPLNSKAWANSGKGVSASLHQIIVLCRQPWSGKALAQWQQPVPVGDRKAYLVNVMFDG